MVILANLTQGSGFQVNFAFDTESKLYKFSDSYTLRNKYREKTEGKNRVTNPISHVKRVLIFVIILIVKTWKDSLE